MFITKTDMVDEVTVQAHIKALKKIKVTATPISIYDDESLKVVQKLLNTIKEEKSV